MKVIAFYLPQFHNIPENDEWWGDGFTEWTNVKAAKQLFEGHDQPVVPLGNNYYNLLDNNVKKWQVNIAREYGVYGFCYYHYWFNGKLLLHHPMEQMLVDSTIDLPFCICWANEPWTKAWVNEESRVLIPQKYGKKEEWFTHFQYLLPFLKDKRYIRVENKPLLVIYRPDVIGCLNDMLAYWQKLAAQSGLAGLRFAYMQTKTIVENNMPSPLLDYHIQYQPSLANRRIVKRDEELQASFVHDSIRYLKRRTSILVERSLGVDLGKVTSGFRPQNDGPEIYSYDEWWETILAEPQSESEIPGAFVGWDNTPRKGDRGSIAVGASPEKFQGYMEQLITKARRDYKTDLLFVNAWNEWAEGAMLEPTESQGYAYLEALKKALLNTGEMPEFDD